MERNRVRGRECVNEEQLAVKQSEIQRQHQKISMKRLMKRTLFIFIGAILMAIGIEIFLVPNLIMDGGIVGISII